MMVATKIKLISSVCIANVLTFASGNAYAWSSPVLTSLKSKDPTRNPIGRPITAFEAAWIASLVNIGAVCGPLLAGCFSEKYGRKKTLLAFSITMLMSHLISAFASTPIEFYVARFMIGLGVGCVYTVIPIYVGEIAVTEIRGLLGCVLSVINSLGHLFVFIIGPFMDIRTFSFVLMVPIGIFIFLFGCFIPESPYYYIAIGDDLAAENSLNKLRSKDSDNILKELAQIKETVDESRNRKLSIHQSFKFKSFRKGITITTALMLFQQGMGITAIISYMENIFVSSGSTVSSSTSTIIVAIIQTCSVILSCYLVDKWGRKLLLILSSGGSALPLAGLGMYFFMKNAGVDVSSLWWLPITCLIGFMVTFNFGLVSIPWALVGELFSVDTKSLGTSITAITNLIIAFTITFIFPNLEAVLGYHGIFWFFTVDAVICMLFVIWYIPETKGKSFQDIQEVLNR